MDFSIVIPAWNEESYLPKTLNSVLAAVQKIEAKGVHRGEVIVVDNNSSDATAAVAAQFPVKVVFEPINQIARARNTGASVARGEALIFLDADSQCSEHLLSVVLEKLVGSSVAGGGSIITPDAPVSASAQRGISFWNWISIKARLAAGCFIYCRVDAFNDIGGFSERVYAGEEIFLSRQLKRWAKRRNLTFDIISIDPVITSARKLEWYSSAQILQQMLFMLIPGAVFSKRFCKTWYDTSAKRR
ncbi:MAG: glycosyltransferase [Granulosicoccus sp.]